MDYYQFQVGFWHPFGPHGGETVERILERKHREIAANGWTLWSFQIRRTLEVWQQHIRMAEPKAVFTFCSEGKGALDPAGEVVNCNCYRFIGQSEWRPMPKGVSVPHPIGLKTEASAFVVKRIFYPVENAELPSVEWFSANGEPWRSSRIPTRGEYLIRSGGATVMRRFRAVLELKDPYLAVVSVEK